MPPTLDDLREQRNEAATKADEIAKRDDVTTAELDEADHLLAQVEDLDKRIKVLQRNDTVQDRLKETRQEPHLEDPARSVEKSQRSYDKAFKKYLRGGMRALNNSEQQTLTQGLMTASGPGFEITVEGRALSTTGTAGGYMIPPEFLRDMVRVMKAFGAVQRVARTVTTDSGAAMTYPSVDDTANVGAILAENVQVSEQDVAWTQKTLAAYMYTSKLVRSSLQLVQDSAFDVEEELRSILGERVARILNQHFTTGTGTAQPQGIVTGATSGVTAASATAVTADEIINLVHSVDPAYRASGRCRFMMSDTALASIRRLKDTTNQYLWQPSMQAGVPDSLFGYPIEINPDMPAMTTGNKPVLFGDFYEGYLIREVRGFQVLRLDERYADYLQVGFLGFARYDGHVRNAGAYKAITLA